MKRTRFLFVALLGTACCWPGIAAAQQPGAYAGETVQPELFAPGGVTYEGTANGGTVQGGTVYEGTVPGGTVPGGTVPGGTVPGSTVPGSTATEGAVPGGTATEGAVSGGVAADGGNVYGGPWHYGYYHTMWGRPVALVVPPQANYQTNYAWGVGNTTVTPIYPQYAGPSYVPVTGASPRPGYLPTPYWPSDTRQFGVYYIRGPW